MSVEEAIEIISRAIACDDNDAHDALDVVTNALGFFGKTAP